MSDDILRRHERCDTCAFRPGTQANLQWTTQLKARLCVKTGTLFHCHEEPEGILCAGFADAITHRYETGELQRSPEWKQAIYRELLEVLDDVEAGKIGGSPADCDAITARVLAALEASHA